MFDSIRESLKKEDKKEEKELVSNIRIKVIGVGGGGSNCINRITNYGIKSAETIAINTDAKHLRITNAHKKYLLGKSITRGLGVGGNTNLARKCAEAESKQLRELIGEAEIVFICAGMGGGTGGGAAPVIARIAKEQGAIVIGMVTFPFMLERVRIKKAKKSIEELASEADTVVVIDNNRLVEYAPNLPIDKAFALADEITNRAVRGISDTIMFPSLLNIDFADVTSVMKEGGISLISIGEGSGYNKIEEAVKETLNNPLLDVDYESAKGCLLHLEGGSDLTLGDAIKAGEEITKAFDENAEVKIGARINPQLEKRLRITAIITGVKSPQILH